MSADRLRFKRGTTAQVAAYLPVLGEPVYDTTLKKLKIGDGVVFGGNELTIDKLSTARSIALTGAVTGSTNFDGSANVSITAIVGSSLQATLDSKAPLVSPALTGTPTVPTASADTNTTQVASTAFVIGQAGSATPTMAGTGAAGTSLRYTRQDHVHPTDTTRAPLASPALTGIPTAPTASPNTNTTQLATTAYADAIAALKANLASPTFTGVPAAPTAAIGTNTTQLATMAALQARILGTVSQSAGVPTGTIIETGGTVSGTGAYTKFADGTMIHVKSLSIGTGSTTAKGSIFGSAATSAGNFTVAYAAAPVVQASGSDSGGGGWAATDAFASTTAWGQYSSRNHVSSGTSGTIFLTATGRWF